MKQKADPHEAGLGPLFSPPIRTLAGRTDPQTSREAAARKAATIGADQEWALRTVRAYPGWTCPEMAAALFADNPMHDSAETVRQRLGRRLNELEKAGLIRRDGVRDGCSIWFPSQEER